MNYTAEDIELNAKEDIELYEEFINGDKEAFNEIIRKYRRSLILFIMRLVKNKEVAEDIAQDAFVYILMNKEEYNTKIRNYYKLLLNYLDTYNMRNSIFVHTRKFI